MSDLPRFTRPPVCPKCLDTDIITRFFEANMDGPHEYVTRMCVCGYSWREMPADQGCDALRAHMCPNSHFSTWEDFHVPQPDGTCLVHGPGGQRRVEL